MKTVLRAIYGLIFLLASQPSILWAVGLCDYPAQLLDLTNWKETIPQGNSESPTEIKQPQLATYVNIPYFKLTPTCDAVQFRAPVNAVTTSGSNYPRSELREMSNKGTTNASWSPSSGVHTMYIDQAIMAVPQTKKHVVAGQIHDANDDVIVIRLEYPKLFVDVNGTDGPTLDTNYTLGKRFNVKFVASNGKIQIFYNNATSPSHTINSTVSGCYFKAGVYTQSNCTKETSCVDSNFGEVHIYDLWVEHRSDTGSQPNTPPTISDTLSQQMSKNTSKTISVLINDSESPSENLILSVASSNSTLVPVGGLVLGGAAAERTLTITPVLNKSGQTTITLTLKDEKNLSASDSFILTVESTNTAPTISGFANEEIEEDQILGPLTFSVGDAESSVNQLIVSKNSSNKTLIPINNIMVEGQGAQRTLSITPAPNQFGTATVTLSLSDGVSSTATSFVVNVKAVNDAPFVSGLHSVDATMDQPISPIIFSISDAETPASDLIISVRSSNVDLVGEQGLSLSGTAGKRTLTLTPVPGKIGSAVITVELKDEGQLIATQSFELKIHEGWVPPPAEDPTVTLPGQQRFVFNPSQSELLSVGAFLSEQIGELSIYDRQGMLIRSWGDPNQSTLWDGRDQKGQISPAGVYWVKFPGGVKKIVVVK